MRSTRTAADGPALVLTRRRGEDIVIGDPDEPIAVVRLVELDGRKARIAVHAPGLPVNRAEIADSIRRRRRAAGGDA